MLTGLLICWGGGSIACSLLGHPFLGAGILFGIAVPFSGLVGRGMAKALWKQQHRLLSSDARLLEDMRSLVDAEDGELVRVRGIARLHDGRGVEDGWIWLRTISVPVRMRVFFWANTLDLLRRMSHGQVTERAVDFALANERGGLIHVEVAGGRLITDDVSPATDREGVREGDLIEVIGCKDRRVDPTAEDRLARAEPIRSTLRSGKRMPLIVVARAQERPALPEHQRREAT
jgi:hypothetical protein